MIKDAFCEIHRQGVACLISDKGSWYVKLKLD